MLDRLEFSGNLSALHSLCTTDSDYLAFCSVLHRLPSVLDSWPSLTPRLTNLARRVPSSLVAAMTLPAAASHLLQMPFAASLPSLAFHITSNSRRGVSDLLILRNVMEVE